MSAHYNLLGGFNQLGLLSRQNPGVMFRESSSIMPLIVWLSGYS